MIRTAGIHHVSLNVTDLGRSVDFYSKIIGLQQLERPNFLFQGAWFAIGNAGQQLHLIVHNGETLRSRGLDTRDGHFAIRVESFEETVEWLEKQGMVYRANSNSSSGFQQIFVLDPDHNIVEMNAE